MVTNIAPSAFEGLEPESLWLLTPGQRLPLAVRELRRLSPTRVRAEPFAVVLRGPAEPMLSQGIHRLAHPRWGEMDLFIVPIGRDASGVDYEIVFN